MYTQTRPSRPSRFSAFKAIILCLLAGLFSTAFADESKPQERFVIDVGGGFATYSSLAVLGGQDTRRRPPDYQGCCRYAARCRTRQVFLDNPQRKTRSVHSRTGEILRAATLGTIKGI